MNDRALVVCRTAAGMRAATWLAQQGVAVRVLCTEAEVPTDPVQWIAGPKARVEALVGPVDSADPVLSLWHAGRVHPMPQTKRSLARAVQPSTAAAYLDLAAGRLHRGPTAEDWVRRWFGRGVWTRAVHGWMDQRLAGPAARVPAGVARRLLGGAASGGWWVPRWSPAERADRRVGRILDSGGEVLVDVALDSLEIEHGRLVGVATEFGLDHAGEVLYTDLAPAEIAAMLPVEERPEVPEVTLGDRAWVEVEGSLGSDVLAVLDRRRRLIEVAAIPGGAVAQVTVAPGDPLFGASDERLGEAVRHRLEGLLEELGPVRGVLRERACVACPRPSAEAPWGLLVHRWSALGIQPLGPTGWSLPLSLLDELELLEAHADGAVIATQRAQWLAPGPPLEPWCLWRQA